MYELNKRISDLKTSFESFKETVNREDKAYRLKELEAQSTDPQLWEDQDNARKLLQELADIKNELQEIDILNEDILILEELGKGDGQDESFVKEIDKLERKLQKLILKTYLSSPYDKKNAMVSIHAGQGGTEAMDWTGILLRMYTRFCEKRGWTATVLDETRGEEAGFKSVTIKVTGQYAYGYLKGESGTHRLVRLSPFNADSLRQTSFAGVEVLPEFAEVDLPDIQINPEDLDIQFYRSGGHGGQNVNKVSTAVRLTHIPTGIVVTAQTERFQEQNRINAMALLRAKLWVKAKNDEKEERQKIKGDYRPASWGTQIRSYVLHPYKMIKDLRTEVETSDTEGVLDGDLDQFVEAELQLK